MDVKFFDLPGRENTNETIALAIKRARELEIGVIVVASNSGETAKRLIGLGVDIVCVTHHVGFAGPGIDEMGEEQRTFLTEQGIKILTTTHLFGGIDRAIRIQAGGLYPAEIVAHTLRMFGQGVKTGIECSVMALDAGLIKFGQKVIALGGTGRGADCAIVLTPNHSNHFFSSKIHEIICKPV